MSMRWEQVPADDQEPLKTLIAEMACLHFSNVQWGDSGVVLSPKGNYRTAFFEAFGVKDGFIRGEGLTVLVAAQKAFAKIKKQNTCNHPDDTWKYTHRNGYKTCGSCGYFAPCTVGEALAHYDHGEVRVPERATYLMFDFRRPLCPACGGHILAHDYAFDIYRCKCGQRLEPVPSEDGVPQYDDQHCLVLRPVDTEPLVIGYWHREQRRWIGEDGHIKTHRLVELCQWPWAIAGPLRNPEVELRLVMSDLSPGDVVPFSFDQDAHAEEFKTSLEAVIKHLTDPER